MARNNARQERIFLRNSQSLANTAAFAATISDNAQKKLRIDTSEIGGWFSPDEKEVQSSALRKNKVQHA